MAQAVEAVKNQMGDSDSPSSPHGPQYRKLYCECPIVQIGIARFNKTICRERGRNDFKNESSARETQSLRAERARVDLKKTMFCVSP
jgi:hypothetical protein